MQEFEKASLNDLLHEEISEHIILETINNAQHGCSPELLQQILPSMYLMDTHIKFMVLKFKENNLLDEELTDLLCSGLDQFITAQQQNSITQKKRENLEKTLNLTQEKIKSLLFIKQLEPEIAKIFLYILLLKKAYLKTISTN
ncbi:hypothetical protein RHABOEDO_000855 [Candidatus Rhabdochlamydia oedothoracis]|uniref:Uncharacterized protein n=1 Tax=Candidatus Rhabdochlamydia oedothoracis TaxID=2720720 RepID=A0ABX8V6K4_9BACT|nr:hypothetical protein [Candidatus Rhabdochlamydia oedothoracis]QYF48655.1 hypothetical protein RHABOEDO_000855 [Candidatus Rhabdochlamydia oedothoracis]